MLCFVVHKYLIDGGLDLLSEYQSGKTDTESEILEHEIFMTFVCFTIELFWGCQGYDRRWILFRIIPRDISF